MNRADFQKISLKKIAEAKTLLKEKAYSGAYYLAGLSIECAFKARLAKAIQKYEFPDKKFVNEIYIHDQEKLLSLSGLKRDLTSDRKSNPSLDTYWSIVKDWSIDSRYDYKINKKKAVQLIEAIDDDRNGLLKWLREKW